MLTFSHLYLIFILKKGRRKEASQQQGEKPQSTSQIYKSNHNSINLASCIMFYQQKRCLKICDNFQHTSKNKMVFLKSLKFFIMLNTSFCFILKKSFFHIQESIFFFHFKHSYICNLTKQWIKSNNPKLLACLSYGSLSQRKTLDQPNSESKFQPLQ